jgi:palmitoyltransferase
MYADELAPQAEGQDVSLRRLSPAGRTVEDDGGYVDDDLFDTSSDEEEAAKRIPSQVSRAEAERTALNLVTNGGWGRSGASGLLRKSPTGGVPANGRNGTVQEDDGVD